MTFEEWYAGYNPAHKSDKERAEDAWKAAAQPAVQQGEPLAWMDDGNLRAGSEATAYRVVTDATRRGMTASLAASFITPLYAHPAAPAAHGDALDAQRYRELRRGQRWSVVDGIGDTLRGDALDAAIDAARAAQGESNEPV